MALEFVQRFALVDHVSQEGRRLYNVIRPDEFVEGVWSLRHRDLGRASRRWRGCLALVLRRALGDHETPSSDARCDGGGNSLLTCFPRAFLHNLNQLLPADCLWSLLYRGLRTLSSCQRLPLMLRGVLTALRVAEPKRTVRREVVGVLRVGGGGTGLLVLALNHLF